jgi:ribosomal protein L7/L12
MSRIDQNTEQQIMEMIATGNKIAAIKLYREITGVALAEAKDAVEAMQRGEPLNNQAVVQVGEPDPFLENQIKRLLAERKKIEAVKAYREAFHCGLKEAKDAVDLIQAEMGREGYSSMPITSAISNNQFAEDTQHNRSCLILVIAFLLVAIGVVAFFFLTGTGF